jgi:SAM-dependent methyltransferase
MAPTLADPSPLRADLENWSNDAIQELVGDRAAAALDREQLVPARLAARAAGDDHNALLTRLFALGDVLSVAQLNRCLPSLGADGAAASGLIATAGSSDDDPARALVDLRPYETEQHRWHVASDLGEAVTGERLSDDHVLGVGGASLTLASITMRTQVGRALDLGTGSGIQALHASTHAGHVVATDISARALEFTRFNAALAGVPLDLRHGSLLEPVAGESFDLVVSNPPFVITPPGAPSFEYRDGGMRGDGIVASLISNVGRVLAPGGVAQMLGNWEIRGGEWSERIEEWLAASPVPLDAWIVQRDALDAAQYAETWLRDAGVVPERGRADFDAAYEAYLTDFDRRGVREVGFGMVLLRRPVGNRPTLRRLESLEGPVASPLGPHLAATLAAHDRLARMDDADLREVRLTVAGDVTKEIYGRPLLVEPEHILIRQGGGFGRAVRADTALAGFVGACDGELSVGQILSALEALGVHHARELLPAIRELVETGCLA